MSGNNRHQSFLFIFSIRQGVTFMTLTRRGILRDFVLCAIAAKPVMGAVIDEANATVRPSAHQQKRVQNVPPLHDKPKAHVVKKKHAAKKHDYDHHRKHPHHAARSMRAQQTLDTPGNRQYLALTIWGEARGYGEIGMISVGNVIMNRVKADKSRYGRGIKGVCHKRKQFSCWNEGDPNRARMEDLPAMDDKNPDWIAWVIADRVAAKLLVGAIKDNTFGATYYCTENLRPYWQDDMTLVGVMFGHKFFIPKKRPHAHHHHSHHRDHHGKQYHHSHSIHHKHSR